MVTAVGSVLDENECLLGGGLFPLSRPPRRVLTSLYAPKVTVGPTTRESRPHVSSIAWSDWRAGIGVERGVDSSTINRAWWSECQLRYRGQLVLGPLATITADANTGTITDVTFIGELGTTPSIYAAWGSKVYKYSNTGDTWSLVHTLPAPATDGITVRLNGTVYLIIAHTGGYSYTTDGSSWTDDTENAVFLEFHQDELWAIDATGQLRHSNGGDLTAAWTNGAQLPLPDGYARDLFTSRKGDGSFILYCMTAVGLFAHDLANSRFDLTEIVIPYHTKAGTGCARFRDTLYIPVGQGVYKYTTGPTAVTTTVGPDRDHGLPSDKRGAIIGLLTGHTDLLALIDATRPGTVDNVSGRGTRAGGHRGSVIADKVGFSPILAWDTHGWECRWLGSNTGRKISAAFISSAYNLYRLYWAVNGRVYHMALSPDIVNPLQVTDFDYAASGDHETPDFDDDDITADKLALELVIETEKCTATEKVTPYYKVNRSGSWTALAAITTDGKTTYRFPNETAPTGTAFRSIRFKLHLERGSNTKLSPVVTRMEFNFRKKVPPRWGWTLPIDFTQDEVYKEKRPKELWDDLVTLVNTNALASFTLREDDANETYYVDVMQLQGQEFTGHDFRWNADLVVLEP